MSTTSTVLSDLHHEVRGEGPPVLFISGMTGDAGHFARTAERLADEFTTVAYDRRGNSRSAKLGKDEGVAVAAQADDAAALIEGLLLVPAIVFGTSDGGAIALDLIARRPDVLRGAIVHEPTLVGALGADEAGDEELELILELAGRNPRAAMEALARMYTTDETFERLDPQVSERGLANAAHYFASELAAFASYVPDTDRVREAGVPLRILASRDGLVEDANATAWFAERIGVPVELVSGHHAPYLQQPEAFAEELRPILRELA